MALLWKVAPTVLAIVAKRQAPVFLIATGKVAVAMVAADRAAPVVPAKCVILRVIVSVHSVPLLLTVTIITHVPPIFVLTPIVLHLCV